MERNTKFFKRKLKVYEFSVYTWCLLTLTVNVTKNELDSGLF